MSRPSFETALSGTLLYIKRTRNLRSRICEIAIYEHAILGRDRKFCCAAILIKNLTEPFPLVKKMRVT
jgi:hypothetical protein